MARTAELQQEVIDARTRALDLQINSILLEAEAKRRGLSTTKLLKSEVTSKAPEPTEAEAQAFFNQNKGKIQGEFKDVKGDIVLFLRTERQQEQAKKLAETLRAAASLKVLTRNVTPPANEADKARVFAVVNGRSITSRDIEESLLPLIYHTQEQVYSIRQEDIDKRINDMLLATEAQKRGTTSQALLYAETKEKVPAISDDAAQKFYDENKKDIGRDFADVKEQVIQYLSGKEEEKLAKSFAALLRRSASIQIFLTAPEPPSLKIATDDQPTRGNLSATVTIIEFTDFQCPGCAKEQPILERVFVEYSDRVRFVVRDFPLPQHENSVKAAEAAEAARDQGKYWEYITVLFNNQSALQVDKLKQYATALGLDRAKFDAALDSGQFVDKVERDKIDGGRLGVSVTPSVYVNGRRATDISYEGLRAMIEAALKPAR
jgi:protein-disulfide isomerase